MTGYPCCSISRQNNHPKSFLDTESKTGSGYDAVVKYVRRQRMRLKFLLLENVIGMLQKRRQFDDEVPMEIQKAALKELGFICVFSSLVNSTEYGLAQSRSRSWSLFVNAAHLRRGYSHEIAATTSLSIP